MLRPVVIVIVVVDIVKVPLDAWRLFTYVIRLSLCMAILILPRLTIVMVVFVIFSELKTGFVVMRLREWVDMSVGNNNFGTTFVVSSQYLSSFPFLLQWSNIFMRVQKFFKFAMIAHVSLSSCFGVRVTIVSIRIFYFFPLIQYQFVWTLNYLKVVRFSRDKIVIISSLLVAWLAEHCHSVARYVAWVVLSFITAILSLLGIRVGMIDF